MFGRLTTDFTAISSFIATALAKQPQLRPAPLHSSLAVSEMRS